MDIIQKDETGYVTLAFKGRLDATSSPDAEAKLKGVLDKGATKVLINLEGLEYISSAGLRVLLVAAKQLRQNKGKIVLCCLVDNVKEVFEISGFSSIFSIFPSLDEAIQSLG